MSSVLYSFTKLLNDLTASLLKKSPLFKQKQNKERMDYTYRMFYFLYRLCLKPEKKKTEWD